MPTTATRAVLKYPRMRLKGSSRDYSSSVAGAEEIKRSILISCRRMCRESCMKVVYFILSLSEIRVVLGSCQVGSGSRDESGGVRHQLGSCAKVRLVSIHRDDREK